MQALNTSNPEHLQYESGILKIAVLGGIRLEGLDRLRTTLKIQVEHLAIRHNLDLYNDTQVDKLIRKVAGKLEVGTSVTAAALQGLTNELEDYRLKEIERTMSADNQKVVLSSEETAAATLYLTAPNLMERTKEDIGKSGVVGEEMNRLLMYLIFTSRKQNQPLHIVSLGSSGTGKTHLQEKVSELIPEEDKLEITSLSENAFYYFGQRQLQNKLILIEDLDGLSATGGNQGGGGAMYPLRELQTKKRISKTVVHKTSRGETKTIHLQVEGPVSVSGCTTKEKIYEDNANRSFLIYLDESAEQDLRIMDYQRAVSAGQINDTEEASIRQLLKNTQRILQPVKVVNPYAPLLCLPQAVFKPRRTNSHYLKFIEAITFYHQFQREEKVNEETGEIFIETTVEDIAAANQLMKEILLRKSDELSGACRNYFEKLKEYLAERDKANNCPPDSGFINREVCIAFRKPISTIKRNHYQLIDNGYLQTIKKPKDQTVYYQLVSDQQRENRVEKIDKVFVQALETCIERSRNKVKVSSTVQKPSTSKNGRVNTPTNNNLNAVVQSSTEMKQGKEKKKITDYFLGIYKQLKEVAETEQKQGFTNKEVCEIIGKTKKTTARYLNELLAANYLERKEERPIKFLIL